MSSARRNDRNLEWNGRAVSVPFSAGFRMPRDGGDEARRWPASEKRQGRKSRDAGHCYGDLSAAVMVVLSAGRRPRPPKQLLPTCVECALPLGKFIREDGDQE